MSQKYATMSTLAQKICGSVFQCVSDLLGVGSCKGVEFEGFDELGADFGGGHLAGGLIGVS